MSLFGGLADPPVAGNLIPTGGGAGLASPVAATLVGGATNLAGGASTSNMARVLMNYPNVTTFGSYLNVPTVTGNNTNLTCPTYDWYNGSQSWSPFPDGVWWNPGIGFWVLFAMFFLGAIWYAFLGRTKLKIYKMLQIFGLSLIIEYGLIVGLMYVQSVSGWYMGALNSCARSIFLYFALGWPAQLLRDYSSLSLFGPTVGIRMAPTDHKKLSGGDRKGIIVAGSFDEHYSYFDPDHEHLSGEVQYHMRDIIMVYGFMTYFFAALASLQAIDPIWQNWSFSAGVVSFALYFFAHIVMFVLHLPSYKQTKYQCGGDNRFNLRHGAMPYITLVFVLFNATVFLTRFCMTGYYIPTENPYGGAVGKTVKQQAETIGILAFVQLWVYLVYALLASFSLIPTFCTDYFVKNYKGEKSIAFSDVEEQARYESGAASTPKDDSYIPLDDVAPTNGHAGEKPKKNKKPKY